MAILSHFVGSQMQYQFPESHRRFSVPFSGVIIAYQMFWRPKDYASLASNGTLLETFDIHSERTLVEKEVYSVLGIFEGWAELVVRALV